MLNKFISVILALLFLFYVAGIYLVFSLIQYSVREEMEEEIKGGIEEKDIFVITVYGIDREEIDWIRPEKEFMYKGEMYDVVKTETSGCKKSIFCISDTREKQLLDNFKRHTHSGKEIESKVKLLFSKIFFYQNITFNYQIFSSDVSFHSIIDQYKSLISKIPLPPPKCISYTVQLPLFYYLKDAYL